MCFKKDEDNCPPWRWSWRGGKVNLVPYRSSLNLRLSDHWGSLPGKGLEKLNSKINPGGFRVNRRVLESIVLFSSLR